MCVHIMIICVCLSILSISLINAVATCTTQSQRFLVFSAASIAIVCYGLLLYERA